MEELVEADCVAKLLSFNCFCDYALLAARIKNFLRSFLLDDDSSSIGQDFSHALHDLRGIIANSDHGIGSEL